MCNIASIAPTLRLLSGSLVQVIFGMCSHASCNSAKELSVDASSQIMILHRSVKPSALSPLTSTLICVASLGVFRIRSESPSSSTGQEKRSLQTSGERFS